MLQLLLIGGQTTQQLLTAGCPQHRRQTKTVTEQDGGGGGRKGAWGWGLTGRTAMKPWRWRGLFFPSLAEDDSDEPPRARCPSMTWCPFVVLLATRRILRPRVTAFAGGGDRRRSERGRGLGREAASHRKSRVSR